MWHHSFEWLNHHCFGRAWHKLLHGSSYTHLKDYAISHFRRLQSLFTSVSCVDRSVQILMYLYEFQQWFKYVLLRPRALYKTYRSILAEVYTIRMRSNLVVKHVFFSRKQTCQQSNSTFRFEVFYYINCAVQNPDWVSKRAFLLKGLSYGSNMHVLHVSFVSFQRCGLHPTL
jgi:hypothetical protein